MEKGKLLRLVNLLKALPKRTLKSMDDLNEMLEAMGMGDEEMVGIMEELDEYLKDLKKQTQDDGEEEERKDRFKLVWDNYNDAVEHFMNNVYKNILSKIPQMHKPMFYQFARDYNRKELSNARKYMVLHQSNYKIKLTEKGVKIVFPAD